MDERNTPPELNMTLDGRFLPGPRPLPWVMRLRPQTLLLVAGATAALIGALLLWLAIMLLPVLVLGGVVGWVALRLRRR